MPAAVMIIGLIFMLFALGGANYYLARRLYQCIGFIFPQTNIKVYTGVFIFMAFVMMIGFARSLLPLPVSVKNILGVAGSYWMGIFIYLFLFFVTADVVIMIGSFMKAIPKPIPRGIRFFSGLAVVLLTLITVVYGVVHANQIKHVAYEIPVETASPVSGLNIVMLSDIHLGAVNSEKRLEKIVQGVSDLKPDLVCIAGDIFDNDYHAIHNPDKAAGLLRSMTSKYGVYVSLGNHDGGETLDEMLAFLERSNIKALNDEQVVMDNRLVLAGRLDSSPIGGFGDMGRQDLSEVMAGTDKDLPVVVMDHNPANIGEYGSGVDLVLCGHTHRGQIFPGSLFTKAMFEVDYGYYKKDDSSPHIVVSSGAGTWGMPMRIGTDCEIVSIKLKGGQFTE